MLTPKTPMQMRREAERGARPKPALRGRVDLSQYPQLHSESGDDIDATIDWLAHLAAGRIEVK